MRVLRVGFVWSRPGDESVRDGGIRRSGDGLGSFGESPRGRAIGRNRQRLDSLFLAPIPSASP
jgi:hypothetical protein